MNWRSTDAKWCYLLLLTGLVAVFAKHGVGGHWSLWDFLIYWFACTMTVLLLCAGALAAIIYSHKFFLGYDWKEQLPSQALFFYILMTVLTVGVGIFFLTHYRPSPDDDYSFAHWLWLS
jgi:hypothetical protein